jgi:hypothetical protein
MSKIIDFYKKAKDDPKIMADIEAVKKKYANAVKFDDLNCFRGRRLV